MEEELNLMIEEMLEDYGAEALLASTAELWSKICKINKKVITVELKVEGEFFMMVCGPVDSFDDVSRPDGGGLCLLE